MVAVSGAPLFLQTRYRRAYGTLDRSYTSTAAKQFQLPLERLDADGEPLDDRAGAQGPIRA